MVEGVGYWRTRGGGHGRSQTLVGEERIKGKRIIEGPWCCWSSRGIRSGCRNQVVIVEAGLGTSNKRWRRVVLEIVWRRNIVPEGRWRSAVVHVDVSCVSRLENSAVRPRHRLWREAADHVESSATERGHRGHIRGFRDQLG